MAVTKGNCYLCGKELGKTAMKNHLLRNHADTTGEQKSYLLKAEGKYERTTGSILMFLSAQVSRRLTGSFAGSGWNVADI